MTTFTKSLSAFLFTVFAFAALGQPTPNVLKNPWSTNLSGTPVQGVNNLSVTNQNQHRWNFYGTNAETVARLFDTTNNTGYIESLNGQGTNTTFRPSAYNSIPLEVKANTGSSALMVNSNGYVGISNPNPTSSLDLLGNGFFSGSASNVPGLAVWKYTGGTIANGAIAGVSYSASFRYNTAVSGYSFLTALGTNVGGYFSAENGANNYALITGSGNVGIGTNAPQSKLHVTDLSANSTPDIRISDDLQSWAFRVKGDEADQLQFVNINNGFVPMSIASNCAENTLVLTNGKVGINNVVNPKYPLDVSGTIRSSDTIFVENTGSPGLQFLRTGTRRYSFTLDSNDGYKLKLDGSGGQYLCMDGDSGTFGIGTTNPTSKLQVTTTNGSPVNAFAVYQTNGAAALTVNSTNGAIIGGGTATFTNGVITQYKPYFFTNYTCTTNAQIYFASGTNQIITLPNAAHVPGVVYRISSTNRWGNFIITNATGAQTIRDGSSFSFTQVGIGSPSFISDGANWWPAARTKVIMPNAQFSTTNTIALTSEDVAYPVSFGSIDFNNSQGIALGLGTNGVALSKMWITNSGQYEFTPSVISTYDGNNTVRFWFRQDNTNVTASSTPQKGQNGSVRVSTVAFSVNVTGPTAFEIWASSNHTGETLAHEAAGGTPPNDYPAAPAVICPVKRISDSFP
jgi:hypothetical protein